jgi:HSP20 family molecular chaperone IbpA
MSKVDAQWTTNDGQIVSTTLDGYASPTTKSTDSAPFNQLSNTLDTWVGDFQPGSEWGTTLITTVPGVSTWTTKPSSVLDWTLAPGADQKPIKKDILIDPKGRYVVRLAIPGYEAEQIHIDIKGHTVLVSLSAADDGDELIGDDPTVLEDEVFKEEFVVDLAIPIDYDTSKLFATLKAGIMTIAFPKLSTAQVVPISDNDEAVNLEA